MQKTIRAKQYSYTVNYQPVKNGGYQVTVPVLPGLVTYGRTLDEAKRMAHDAIKCHIKGIRKEKQVPPDEHSLLQEKVTLSV